jgi:hypothetical protein
MTGGTPRRVSELDALRGLMLLWITATHLPTPVSTYVNQPFGFFAGTEGFIFLSALFTGLIYFRIAEREGWRSMCRRLWARAGRLYGYHLLLLLVAFGIGAPLAARGNRPAFHNLLDFYYAVGRTRAYLDAALLLYRPPLLDILPIYIIFLALTPLAIWMGSRLGWRCAFAGGFTVWVLAQLGLRSFAHDLLTAELGLQVPLNEMGAFDLSAWQLWWLIGLWLGVRWAREDLHLEAWAKRLALPAALISGSLLVVRYAQLEGLIALGKSAWLLDKWNLGPGRIVDFAAVAALTIRFRSALKPLAMRPLVMLGSASLEVFCVHLLCVFSALIILRDRPVIRGWAAGALILASWSAMLLTAALVIRAKRVRAPTTGARGAERCRRPDVSQRPRSGNASSNVRVTEP